MSRFLTRVLPLAGLLLTAGTLHFVTPKPFESIMPGAIPEEVHRPLTYASGAAELTVGALLLGRRTRKAGGWLAAALFLGIWPANIEAALMGGYKALPGFWGSSTAAWLRVPLQLPLIAWGAWIGRGAGEATR